MLTVIPLCWWPVIVWYVKHCQGKKKEGKKEGRKKEEKSNSKKSCLYLSNTRIPNVITTIFVSHNYLLWTDSMTNKSCCQMPCFLVRFRIFWPAIPLPAPPLAQALSVSSHDLLQLVGFFMEICAPKSKHGS